MFPLRERPIDRLLEERALMRPLPEREPCLDRRWVVRVPPDPHLRFEAGHPLVERVLLGAEPDLEIEVRVAPDRFAVKFKQSFVDFDGAPCKRVHECTHE